MSKQHVIDFVLAFSEPNRHPVAWTLLTCGHTGPCETVPWKGKGPLSNPHNEADRLTKIGDEVECTRCDHYKEALEILKNLKPGDLQHSRFRPTDSRGGKEGRYYVYVREQGSPTGVKLLLSIEATPEADKVLSALQASPLSPTERR